MSRETGVYITTLPGHVHITTLLYKSVFSLGVAPAWMCSYIVAITIHVHSDDITSEIIFGSPWVTVYPIMIIIIP